MDFFYPNRTNMMWEIFGEVFFKDPLKLVDIENKSFFKEDIIKLLRERGIAIYDTACAVRRLQGNASDKFLEVVEKTDIPALLSQIPLCHDIVCTGQKSTETLLEDFGASPSSHPSMPKMGEHSPLLIAGREMRLWRMPSSSRAYPMKLQDKAAYYRKMMQHIGLV